MKRFLVISCLFFLVAACSSTEVIPPPVEEEPQDTTVFYRGADLSFIPKIRTSGYQYTADNQPIDVLPYFAESGMNLIRIRLWNDPWDIHSSLPEVLALAQEAHALGLDILLDFHFSDSWADPGQQTKPQAWNGLSFVDLRDTLYFYTRSVIEEFNRLNIPLAMVQIGNETNSGFLWDTGRVGGAFDNQWSQFVELFNFAARAVRELQPDAKIVAHISDYAIGQWYFQNFTTNNADFDVIALSYYPFWHGADFAAFQTAVNQLINEFEKPIFIAETAYPFTFSWNDWTNNLVWSDDPMLPNYPATVDGQRDFLLALRAFLETLPAEDCLGFCYWAPDFVSYLGPQSQEGSPWENLALFDFDGNALSGIEVFAE